MEGWKIAIGIIVFFWLIAMGTMWYPWHSLETISSKNYRLVQQS